MTLRRFHLLAPLLGLLLALGGLFSPTPARAADTAGYIRTHTAAAQGVQLQYGVPASVAMAQSILETGWGGSSLSTTWHNFFGIKCSKSYVSPFQSGCVDLASGEYYPGTGWTSQVSPFRTYASDVESFRDYGLFLTENPRYANAFTYSDQPKEFIRQVWLAGYATDPDYVAKIVRIMDTYNLYSLDLRPVVPTPTPTPTPEPIPVPLPTGNVPTSGVSHTIAPPIATASALLPTAPVTMPMPTQEPTPTAAPTATRTSTPSVTALPTFAPTSTVPSASSTVTMPLPVVDVTSAPQPTVEPTTAPPTTPAPTAAEPAAPEPSKKDDDAPAPTPVPEPLPTAPVAGVDTQGALDPLVGSMSQQIPLSAIPTDPATPVVLPAAALALPVAELPAAEAPVAPVPVATLPVIVATLPVVAPAAEAPADAVAMGPYVADVELADGPPLGPTLADVAEVVNPAADADARVLPASYRDLTFLMSGPPQETL